MRAPLSQLPMPSSQAQARWPALPPSGDSWCLALQAQQRPWVVFTAQARDAQRLYDEIRWWQPQLRTAILPDWETLPYDAFSPHHDLISERLSTLHSLILGECDLLLVAVSTALSPLPPAEYLTGMVFHLCVGQPFNRDSFLLKMRLASYQQVHQVQAPGEFSLRGGMLDLFPMGSVTPYRLELVGDTIETMRVFDVDSQRTLYPVMGMKLLPRREYPLDEAGRTFFRTSFREAFEGDPTRSDIYQDVSKGLPVPGLEYYLPLFFPQRTTLFDYLPATTCLVMHGDVAEGIRHFWQEARGRYQLLGGDRARPLLPPQQLFLSEEDFFIKSQQYPRVVLTLSAAAGEGASSPMPLIPQRLPALGLERKAAVPVHRLQNFISQFSGRILIVADSPGRQETLRQMLQLQGISVPAVSNVSDFIEGSHALALTHGPLSNGFAIAGFAFVSEAELYDHQGRSRQNQRRGAPENLEGLLRDLTELQIGQLVVHSQHGIGRYLGLKEMDLGDGATEFLHLGYADDETLYVPVTQLQLIHRYSGGDPDHTALSKLGSGQWDKAKERARSRAKDTAAELLSLYAQRSSQHGLAMKVDQLALQEFASNFQFDETEDQLTTITAVLQDMAADRPMDRLVCGDVGFGKTEVALRSAHVAVHNQRQVAVLTPTTLLAEQHLRTFQDRFAASGAKVVGLSRLHDSREQTSILAGLSDGSIDIVIGTHRLLQSDVRFQRLGLVILDEEHRFGVRQKEALKHLRSQVDVLTLSATPIPRTLGMAMEGLRDISIIATAPQRRLSVKTLVLPYGNGMVREACLREFNRGGQVYFLYNDVRQLPIMEKKIAQLLPEARIAIAHGQMPERTLERVMRDFTQQRFNLLLCSTIIETGLDIPTANTILIHRADKFGLAQLHQLRGRVGRSHHQAYAYLFTMPGAKLTPAAQRRLEAISQLESLGSGFFLAMQDLEIRGAGEVLGEAQSGAIEEVGYQMYADLLRRAITTLQKPDSLMPDSAPIEVDLHAPMLLDNDYVPDVHERLVLYKRLAHISQLEALESLREELIDRFGPLPPAAGCLFAAQRLRLMLGPLGLQRLHTTAQAVHLQFSPTATLDFEQVMALIRKIPDLSLKAPNGLLWKRPFTNALQCAQDIEALFASLLVRAISPRTIHT